MAQMPDQSTAHSAKPRWKPLIWLLLLDGFSILLLILGLFMQFSPDSGVAQALPPAAKLPLLVIGGGLFGFCWFALARSVFSAHRRD
jgi:hypothetical protein